MEDKKSCVNQCGDTVIKEVITVSEEHKQPYVEVCTSCDKVLRYLNSKNPKKEIKKP